MKLAIIGGGPVGMYCAYWASKKGINVTLFEEKSNLGGQLVHSYPLKEIFDLPGTLPITAKKFAENLTDQLFRTEIDIKINTAVLSIGSKSGKTVVETKEDSFIFDGICIAVGSGVSNPKELSADDFKFKENIRYFVKNLKEFEHKNIMIFGGGDSALDNVGLIRHVANSVSLVHRRNNFKGLAKTVQLLKSDQHVEILTPYKFDHIEKSGQNLVVTLQNIENRNLIKKEFDIALVNFGLRRNIDFIKKWGIEVRFNRIVVNQQMMTNIDNVYSIGDVTFYDGKVDRMTNGFGEAQVAIESFIHHTAN